MKLHANARTCPKSRRLLVRRVEEEGWSLGTAASAAGISERSACKWLGRWRAEGEAGLIDRSSAPQRIPHRTPESVVEAIAALRRLRMTAAEIAEVLGLALSTVSAWLKRIGLGKRSRLEPPEPPNRYERARPGELAHIDVKKLGRFAVAGKRMVGRRYSSQACGWERCHVCVDDATRLAYVEVLPDERGETSSAFLRRAVAWFAERGVRVERVMTDNGSPYISTIHAVTCRELGIRHLRTRPYRPQTNGKAERFIQTMLREWAYGRIYASSTERHAALGGWLDRYNYRRKHGSLGHRPPAAHLNELLGNNLARTTTSQIGDGLPLGSPSDEELTECDGNDVCADLAAAGCGSWRRRPTAAGHRIPPEGHQRIRLLCVGGSAARRRRGMDRPCLAARCARRALYTAVAGSD